MYEIEDSVPMPSNSVGRKLSPEREILRKLLVGQSFLIPQERAKSVKPGSIRSMATAEKIKVATQKVEGGFRIWRVE